MTPMTSAHFNDFGPQLDPNQPEEYATTMIGPGRWFVMIEDGSAELVGVLWTDDKDALGLIAVEASDRARVAATRSLLRAARAARRPARDVFDELLQQYRPSTYGEGALQSLLDAL